MMLWPWVIAGVCGLIVLGEVAFRIFLRVRGVHFLPPKTHRNFYIVPHPYLPFVYKPHSVVDNTQVAPYPLHRGRYEFKSTRINNIRFSDEDVRSQKQPGTVRVMCLGSSSIASSIWEVGNPKQYSIAICLRESLEQRFGSHRYEVLNCGMGGWTSAEIFINFALHLIDLGPNIVPNRNSGWGFSTSLPAETSWCLGLVSLAYKRSCGFVAGRASNLHFLSVCLVTVLG